MYLQNFCELISQPHSALSPLEHGKESHFLASSEKFLSFSHFPHPLRPSLYPGQEGMDSAMVKGVWVGLSWKSYGNWDSSRTDILGVTKFHFVAL